MGNVSNPVHHKRITFLVFYSERRVEFNIKEIQGFLWVDEKPNAWVWWQTWEGNNFALQSFSSEMRLAGSSQAESEGCFLSQQQHSEAML